jgi:hypothetical protein
MKATGQQYIVLQRTKSVQQYIVAFQIRTTMYCCFQIRPTIYCSFQQYIVNNIVVSPSRQTIHCDVSDALLLERTRQEMYTKTCRCYKEGQKAMTDDTLTEKRRIK